MIWIQEFFKGLQIIFIHRVAALVSMEVCAVPALPVCQDVVLLLHLHNG